MEAMVLAPGNFVQEFNVDKWRDERYAQEVKQSEFAYVQWNGKQLTKPPMHITCEQAERAGFVGDSLSWVPSTFSYQKQPGRPVVTEEVFECEKPILSIVREHRKQWVFRTNIEKHKKGDIKPADQPVNKELHILQTTYIVAILERYGYKYRLLHTEPIMWTPKGTVGAKMALEVVTPFRNTVKTLYGIDVPIYLFAIDLEPSIRVVGTTEKVEIHVPNVTIPNRAEDFKSLFVGDEIASKLRSWYHDLLDRQNPVMPEAPEEIPW